MKKLTPKQRQALKRRFLNFESVEGAFILIPWGAGFVYCGLFDLKLGYSYALLSVGLVLIVWGIRKTFVDRVKQKVKLDRMVEEAKAEVQ